MFLDASILNTDNFNYIGEGEECFVSEVMDGILYKYYPYRYPGQVRVIYDRAVKAAAAGIGPDVYGIDEGGYLTEKVQLLETSVCIACPNGDCCGCDWTCCRIFQTENKFSTDGFLRLRDKANELFSRATDFRRVSIGVKNGKLIMIDFGDLSF